MSRFVVSSFRHFGRLFFTRMPGHPIRPACICRDFSLHGSSPFSLQGEYSGGKSNVSSYDCSDFFFCWRWQTVKGGGANPECRNGREVTASAASDRDPSCGPQTLLTQGQLPG
jgi:hypothetical protein